MVAQESRFTTSKDTKNVYEPTENYLDHSAEGSGFPAFEIKLTKVDSVRLLLASDEVDVIQKALHHLDEFASRSIQQLQLLQQSDIDDAFTKLLSSDDVITKRFSLKLLVQLVSNVDGSRQKFLNNQKLIEDVKNIFNSSSDEILVEYSSILLHSISDDPKQVDSLGRDEIFLKNVFEKIKSHDADILLRSLRLLNVVMQNSMLIESILERKDFPFEKLQIELKNDVEDIRTAALESFLLITNFQANPFGEFLCTDQLIDVIFSFCMNDENGASQKTALLVFRNFCKKHKILVKLSQSDYLMKFLIKLNDESSMGELLLGILMKFASIEVEVILDMLKVSESSVAAYEAAAIMSTNIFSLRGMLDANIYATLMSIASNDEFEWSHRNEALIAFLSLVNIRGLKQLLESADEIRDGIVEILLTSKKLFVLMTVISLLFKLSEYHEMKSKIAQTNIAQAIFLLLKSSTRSELKAKLFNLISTFMDQQTFQRLLSTKILIANLNSSSTQLQAAVCNLIISSVEHRQVRELILRDGILKALMSNTSCQLCSIAIDAILSNDVSMKFAVRRHLEAKDKTASGFFASKGQRVNFQLLREVLYNVSSSPIDVVCTVNFESPESKIRLGERQLEADGALVDLLNAIKVDADFTTGDLNIKVNILAQNVFKFFTSNSGMDHQVDVYLNDLKFKFSSSVIPLGCLLHGNSFEAALLFKVLADQLEIDASFHSPVPGKGWNQTCEEMKIADLMFNPGEVYEVSSLMARKYLRQIS